MLNKNLQAYIPSETLQGIHYGKHLTKNAKCTGDKVTA